MVFTNKRSENTVFASLSFIPLPFFISINTNLMLVLRGIKRLLYGKRYLI